MRCKCEKHYNKQVPLDSKKAYLISKQSKQVNSSYSIYRELHRVEERER